MRRATRVVLFVISLLLMGAVIGFLGYSVYTSQQESAKLKEEQAINAQQEAEAAKAAAAEPTPEATPEPTAPPINTVEPTPEATPEPTPEVGKIVFSVRGDALDEESADKAKGYPAMLQKMMDEQGFINVEVQDNTWKNVGTLSQMRFAGVSEEDVNAFINKHQEMGPAAAESDYALTEVQVRDDLEQQNLERTDVDAIPIICMGYAGGWNYDPAELAEQQQKILDTFSQQEKFLIVGSYPAFEEWNDASNYDSVMASVWGEHYLSINNGNVDQPKFSEEGHQQLAEAIYYKLESLGYLDNAVKGIKEGEDADKEEKKDDEDKEDKKEETKSESEEDVEEEAPKTTVTLTADGGGSTITVTADPDGNTYRDEDGVIYQTDGTGYWNDSLGRYWTS